VEHFRVKFGDLSCIVFLDIVRKNRQKIKVSQVNRHGSLHFCECWLFL